MIKRERRSPILQLDDSGNQATTAMERAEHNSFPSPDNPLVLAGIGHRIMDTAISLPTLGAYTPQIGNLSAAISCRLMQDAVKGLENEINTRSEKH